MIFQAYTDIFEFGRDARMELIEGVCVMIIANG